MKKRLLFFGLLAFSLMKADAQSKATILAYIETYKTIAIAEMQRTGVPASITLAQGIHETGAGTSDLVIRSNNHFGIKCKTGWEGGKVYHDDDARGECFRKYDDPFISYQDHSDFLRARPHYASLFKLDATDYEAWAHGLKKAGYATNPKYPQILIKLIRDYNLQDYTLIAMGREPQNEQRLVDVARAQDIPTLDEAKQVAYVATPNYPAGDFTINDTKVVVIKQGTSYLKIAEERDIPLSRLLDFNDLKDGDIAAADGLLFLQRKRKTGAVETHVFLQGETLYDVAQKEGIRLQNLLEYNLLTAEATVQPGEALYLTKSAPAMPKLAASRPVATRAVYTAPVTQQAVAAAQGQFHTVQPKETMFGIAKKYGVTTDDLKTWNGMDNTELKIGQQLRINKTN